MSKDEPWESAAVGGNCGLQTYRNAPCLVNVCCLNRRLVISNSLRAFVVLMVGMWCDAESRSRQVFPNLNVRCKPKLILVRLFSTCAWYDFSPKHNENSNIDIIWRLHSKLSIPRDPVGEVVRGSVEMDVEIQISDTFLQMHTIQECDILS